MKFTNEGLPRQDYLLIQHVLVKPKSDIVEVTVMNFKPHVYGLVLTGPHEGKIGLFPTHALIEVQLYNNKFHFVTIHECISWITPDDDEIVEPYEILKKGTEEWITANLSGTAIKNTFIPSQKTKLD